MVSGLPFDGMRREWGVGRVLIGLSGERPAIQPDEGVFVLLHDRSADDELRLLDVGLVDAHVMVRGAEFAASDLYRADVGGVRVVPLEESLR